MWSPVQTESKPSSSTRRTRVNCSSGGSIESWTPNRITPSPRERVPHAAVDGERAPRGLRRPVRGEEQDRLGDVLRQDADAEQVAPAVELLQLVHRDALSRGALAPDLLGPELRVLEDGVRVHDVRANPVGRALEREHLRE